MKNITEINKLIEELLAWESFIEEMKEYTESMRDELKQELLSRGVEELDTAAHIIRWTSVKSSRFDTKAFKERMGVDLYKAFTKEVSSKRFSISA